MEENLMENEKLQDDKKRGPTKLEKFLLILSRLIPALFFLHVGHYTTNTNDCQ